MIFWKLLALIMLYGLVGTIVTIMVCNIANHDVDSIFSFLIIAITWPLHVLMLLLLLLVKIIEVMASRPIGWILWLIVLVWFFAKITPARAACVPMELEQGWKESTIVQGEQSIALIELAAMNVVTPTPPSPEDLELMANVIFYENRDSEYAMWLTGLVVLNRVYDPDFPNTVREVLYQKHPTQYSTTQYFFTKEIPEEVYILARKIFRDDGSIPRNVVYQAQFKQGSGVYDHPGDYFCYK